MYLKGLKKLVKSDIKNETLFRSSANHQLENSMLNQLK